MRKLVTVWVCGILFCLDAAATDWLSFRGPGGSGVAESGQFPDRVDPHTNLVWKVAIPPGKSSPVIIGDRILITGHEGDHRFVLCYDSASGKELWRRTLQVERSEHRHKLNDAASPSPVSDGERVFAFFADFGILGYTVAGDEIWRHTLGPFESEHGLSASPVYSSGKVFLLMDHLEGSFITAFDAQTGRTIWRTDRNDYAGSYSTPAIHGEEIIAVGPGEIAAYSTESGQKIWYATGLPYQPKSLPVVGKDMVFVNVKGASLSGTFVENFLSQFDKNQDRLIDAEEAPSRAFARFIETADENEDGALSKNEILQLSDADGKAGALRAVRLGGKGDVTDTHLVWRYDRSLANVPSPLLYRNVIYSLRNGGILTALDAATGRLLKQGRLPEALDPYYASPVAGGDKIYALSENGKLTVIRAGESWEVLSTVDLGEAAYASPALSEGSVFVRTMESLYRFGDG